MRVGAISSPRREAQTESVAGSALAESSTGSSERSQRFDLALDTACNLAFVDLR